MGTYYPSAKIRITIRLDEFGDGSSLTPQPPKTAKNIDGVKSDRAPLVPQPDPQAPAGAVRYILVPQGQTVAQAATSYQESTDGHTFDVTIVPREMEVDLNGVRTADTFRATIRYIDLPIDPRTVRAAAVECFLGTMREDDFVKAIENPATTSGGDQGLINVLPDQYSDNAGNVRTNSRFVGWVDDWKPAFGQEDGESMIEISGRDNTALLVDTDMPAKLVLDMNKRVDEAVALFLSNFPAMQGLSVQYLPSGLTPPSIGPALQKTAYRPNLGPHMSKTGIPTGKLNLFDYLTDVLGSIGHIIYLDGTTVNIQMPRTLTTKNREARVQDPFKGRVLPSGEHIQYRRMVYGRNIKTMSINRKFAKGSPLNIEVRTYDTETKRTLVARFPLPADRVKYVLPGDARTDTKWTVVKVYGIKDQSILTTVAQSYYESQGRNELQVELETDDLASFGGDNDDPDLLDMKAADTFEVLLAREDQEEASTLTSIESKLTSQARNEAFMRNLGLSPAFAAAYAKAYTDAGFVTQFRLKAMKMRWSIEDGIGLELTGVNYIEVRLDKSQASGDEPGTKPTDFTSVVRPTTVNSQG